MPVEDRLVDSAVNAITRARTSAEKQRGDMWRFTRMFSALNNHSGNLGALKYEQAKKIDEALSPAVEFLNLVKNTAQRPDELRSFFESASSALPHLGFIHPVTEKKESYYLLAARASEELSFLSEDEEDSRSKSVRAQHLTNASELYERLAEVVQGKAALYHAESADRKDQAADIRMDLNHRADAADLKKRAGLQRLLAFVAGGGRKHAVSAIGDFERSLLLLVGDSPVQSIKPFEQEILLLISAHIFTNKFKQILDIAERNAYRDGFDSSHPINLLLNLAGELRERKKDSLITLHYLRKAPIANEDWFKKLVHKMQEQADSLDLE